MPSSDDSGRPSDDAQPQANPPQTTGGSGESRPSHSWLDRLKDLMGLKPQSSIRDDLQDALKSAAEGVAEDFSPEERAMLTNILGLREIKVHDVMVPRVNIIAVPADLGLAELLLRFEEAEHSRLPIYRETLDEPLGMVHIKDLMRRMTREAGSAGAGALDLSAVNLGLTIEEAGIQREVLYVPSSMPAIRLLARMQASHTHMALVIDEYGGTDGLVTIEDLVETIVGDIEDEHDEVEASMITLSADGGYVADARVALEDVAAEIPDLEIGDLVEDVDTLGGYLVMLSGRVPAEGEVIPAPNGAFEFTVVEADPRRLKVLRIMPREVLTPADEPQFGEPPAVAADREKRTYPDA